MLWNVLIVKLEKLYTVNLYVFLSALYMLQYVPIVTILVNCIFIQKKKNDPYFDMGKNTKVMPQYPAIYLFLLGKAGNPYVSKPYIKTKYKCTFCPALSTKKIQTKHGRCTSKLPKICTFCPQILHLSSNRREQNLALYFQFMTPARKLTHTTKYEHFWMQKDMNFRNARILWHFGPEKRQKSAPERHKFWECHDSLALWAREMPKISPRKTRISGTP